jgi:hypothetical protein
MVPITELVAQKKELVAAARLALTAQHGRIGVVVRLSKALWTHYPEHRVAWAKLLSNGTPPQVAFTAEFVATVLAEWASEASNIDEQRAAVRKREEDVAAARLGMQQLIVCIVGMVKHREEPGLC